jgi:acrylyl-CoA reductase (NADPH)
MEKFRACRIFEEDGRSRGRLVDLSLDELDTGDVVIRTAFSSVNFKDALTATGAGKVVRRFPCVGGIDGCGTVVSSGDPRFSAGDEVICTSYDLGVAHDGGYAGLMRVPAGWVVPLPRGLTLFESMALGTAGYTAALAIHLLEHNGMKPDGGPVVVNGATGGCASLAISMLAKLGYEVTAVTGKSAEHDYLKSIGAAQVLGRDALPASKRPLDKAVWAAGFDSVGADQLAAMIRSMLPHGAIASFGNAGGIELHTTVLPFILRGVRLIGVDSAATPMPLRQAVWARLASDLKPPQLAQIASVITLEELPSAFERMLQQKTRGRMVVRLT